MIKNIVVFSDLEQELKRERRRLFLSMVIPFVLVALMWVVWVVGTLFSIDLFYLGILPREASGLWGVLTSPFIHADAGHLLNNSLPLFILGTALFYFYSKVAFRVLFFTMILTGITVWIFGRQSYHIGASGIIYGLASFLFFSGILRMHIPLVALSLLVAFLYGQMVWGIFPGFRVNISWESHMLGALSGIFLAILFRRQGPQRPLPFPDEEEDEDEVFENSDENREIIN